MDLQSTIILFLIIMFLTIIHELGHLIVARLNNIKVSYFAIGFGPHLGTFKDSKGTNWCINLIPLGGYVEMSDDGNETDAMLSMTPFKNILVSLGGPLVNILFFLLGGTIFYNIIGLDVVEHKYEDSFYYIRHYDKENPPSTHFLIYKDKNNQFKSMFLPHHKNNFNIETNQKTININMSLLHSFQLCFLTMRNFTYKIIYVFTHISEIKKLRSILVAYKQIKLMIVKDSTTKTKMKNIIFYLLIFSLQLGIFNLLPIVGLDGFWVLFSIINLIFKPSLSTQRKIITFIDYGTKLTFFFMGVLLFRDIYQLIVEFFM
jgi:regulator of sigma E protease